MEEKGAEKPKRTAEEQEALRKSRRLQRKAEDAAAQDKEKEKPKYRCLCCGKLLQQQHKQRLRHLFICSQAQLAKEYPGLYRYILEEEKRTMRLRKRRRHPRRAKALLKRHPRSRVQQRRRKRKKKPGSKPRGQKRKRLDETEPTKTQPAKKQSSMALNCNTPM